jgi:hypothetical protein
MSDNTFPEESLPAPAEKPKRERAPATDPMSLAKLAATKLRTLDADKGKLLLAIDRYQAKVKQQDEARAAFVLTLSDPVIAILKAGGSL